MKVQDEAHCLKLEEAKSAALSFLAIFPLKVINAIVPHRRRSHLLLITSQRDGVSEYRQRLRLE